MRETVDDELVLQRGRETRHCELCESTEGCEKGKLGNDHPLDDEGKEGVRNRTASIGLKIENKPMTDWVRLASSSSSRVEVDEDGLAFLKSCTTATALLTFVGGGWSSRRAALDALSSKVLVNRKVPPAESQGSLWVRREPLSKSKDAGTVLIAECSGMLDDGNELAALALLSSSAVLFAAAAKSAALEQWSGPLEALMSSLVSFDDESDDHEAVFSAMPALVWAFEEAPTGSPAKALDALLTSESGFSEEVSRRNNARHLVKSVFQRRDATRLDPKTSVGVGVEASQPKLAFGRVCSGQMLASMIELWCDGLRGEKKKATVLPAYRAAIDGLYRRSLEDAERRFDEAVTEAGELPMDPDALDEALEKAIADAEALVADATRAVAPSPRAAGTPPRPPVAGLRQTLRKKSAEIVRDNAELASKACEAHLDAAHSSLLATADKAAGLVEDDEAGDDDGFPEEDDDDDEIKPTSRRAELWIQAYKGRLGGLVADYASSLACADACRGAAGEYLSYRLGDAPTRRCRRALATLDRERSEILSEMKKKRESAADLGAELAELQSASNAAMKRHNESLMTTMADTETGKMEKEAELASIDMEIDSALRNAERVDARLRVKLEGAVSRASSRLDDAKMLRQRNNDAALALASDALKARNQLADARLDALRVRCVTLGHEKANLGEHMELLEEHLERLKADLEQKHAEVAEVEHQWSQTKAKLPSLKSKHAETERRRALLADLARKLKQACKQAGKGSTLPRQLLQHLDPMERQALDDL